MKFLLLFLVLVLSSCESSKFEESVSVRKIASEENKSEWMMDLKSETDRIKGTLEFPEGLSDKEASSLWHLSEGSDVYPLKWMTNLESATFPNTRFLEKLDDKYGVVYDPLTKEDNYPLKWVGLSAAWSSADPKYADAYGKDSDLKKLSKVKYLKNRKASIVMSGVNCAFCHTAEVRYKGQSHIIEGAPSMLFIRGYFFDMFSSTLKTMLDEDLLTDFLRANGVEAEARPMAQAFVNDFLGKLGLKTDKKIAKIAQFLYSKAKPGDFRKKKIEKVRNAVYKNRDVVEDKLIELLLLTYNLNEDELTNELKLRMKWLATSMTPDPDLALTPEGYARTDAFGRISNWVARVNDPIELTATTSVPSMWGIKYKAMFHYNSNTNSIMSRNIGQSFGLGSIMLNAEKFETTSNVHNLARLEKYLYKIRTPDWHNLYSEVELLDKEKLEDGCNTYANKCIHCHQADERVGPDKKLINHKIVSLDFIKTDPHYLELQSIPVGDSTLNHTLEKFSMDVKNKYYEKHNISKSEQEDWEHTYIRGKEVFRDTLLGEDRFSGSYKFANIEKEKAGYVARSLAGVWASAPYLHNGSVPTIKDLLSKPEDRPEIFFVGSNIYDGKKLGFKNDLSSLPDMDKIKTLVQKQIKKLPKKYRKKVNMEKATLKAACELYPARCFDVSSLGNSNVGHVSPSEARDTFGTYLPKNKKENLIEFLKILKPAVEYSWPRSPFYKIVKKGKKNVCEFYDEEFKKQTYKSNTYYKKY